MSIKDLVKKRGELRKDLHASKMKNALRSLSQTHTITKLKRDIARINTVLTSKIKAA